MKETDNFESWVRSKLAEKPFPYDEAYWEKAEAQFAAWDQKKKKRRFLFWLFTFGLLASGVGGWFLTNPLQNPSIAAMDSVVLDSCEQYLEDGNQIALAVSPDLLPAFDSVQNSNASTTRSPSSPLRALSSNQSQDPSEPTRHTNISSRIPQVLESSSASKETLDSHVGLPVQASAVSPEAKELFIKALGRASLSDWTFRSHFPSQVSIFSPEKRRVRPYVKTEIMGSPYQLNNLRNTSLSSLNPSLELGLDVPFGSRLSLQPAVSYYGMSIHETSANLSYIEYDFIFRSEEIQWTPERLHYIGGGLGLAMRIFPRHSIGAGVRAGYLLTTKGQMVEGFRNSFESTNEEPETVYHYTNGLQDWDGQVRLTYAYSLSRKWSMQLAGQYGLRNLTKDELFTQKNANRHSGLSVSLQYWFR